MTAKYQVTETGAITTTHQLMIESLRPEGDGKRLPSWSVLSSCSCGVWATVTGYASRHDALKAANQNHVDHVMTEWRNR